MVVFCFSFFNYRFVGRKGCVHTAMRSVARKAKKGKRKKKKPKVEAPRILTAAEREELKRKEDDARRERAVQRQQTKRLNLVKQFWHGSLQSRTLPEEVLGVEPLMCCGQHVSHQLVVCMVTRSPPGYPHNVDQLIILTLIF